MIDVMNFPFQIDQFNSYCQPIGQQRYLSPLCIQFTGITQQMVDNSAKFPQVLNEFTKWLGSFGLMKNDGSLSGQRASALWLQTGKNFLDIP